MGDRSERAEIPEAVLRAFPELTALSARPEIRPLTGGLLHKTYRVQVGKSKFVLQKVNKKFGPGIHDNIKAVTGHLLEHGVATFRLLKTADGGLFATDADDERWRLMTHVDGVSFEDLQSPAQAYSAGLLVGRFHAALDSFDKELAPMGIPFRNTPWYLKQMERSLEERRDHPDQEQAKQLAAAIHSGLRRLGPSPQAPDVPDRVIHGDFKVSNLLFESAEEPGRDRAVAVLDLDTLMRHPLWSELGDAWRSWCDTSSDEESSSRFDLGAFAASWSGFRKGYGGTVTNGELRSLVTGTERMALELAARFVTNALTESYFVHTCSHPSEHDMCRARAQLDLFEAAQESQRERAEILGVA